jgi:hypothetical protein
MVGDDVCISMMKRLRGLEDLLKLAGEESPLEDGGERSPPSSLLTVEHER